MKISLTTEQTTAAIEQYVMTMLHDQAAWTVKDVRIESYAGSTVELVQKGEVEDDRDTD